MALQIGGQISLSNIAGEMNQIGQNISLVAMSTSSTLNDQSPSKPNEAAPHGISEFYSYDHSYSSLKALMGGSENPTTSGKWFDFCSDDMKTFYAHDGSKDFPQVGDGIYLNDRGSYYLVGSSFILIGHPEMTESFVVRTDNGKVMDINSCEGIGGDPKEPGVGGPDEDPFRR